VAQDPWAIDNSGGLPAYSGQELRLITVAPFVAGNGTALGTRSGVRLGGSGTELLVQAQASPNMTVKVNPGIFVAQGQTSSTQGAYTWCLDTVTNLTISAAHATLARTDLIVVRIRDANIDTSGARDGNVIVITGTAGGGVPSLPTDASYYTIAQISVSAAVTNIGGGGGGTITDKRTFVAALGGVIPCLTAAKPSPVPAGQLVYLTDATYSSARFNYYDGSAYQLMPGAQLLAPPVILGSPAATVTFSSIPQGFGSLLLVGDAAASPASFNVDCLIQISGDTGAHYSMATWDSSQAAQNPAGSFSNANTSLIWGFALPGSSFNANRVGAFSVLWPGYSGTTLAKASLHDMWMTDGGTSYTVHKRWGYWNNAGAAITSLLLTCGGGGNFVAGSSFYLYGLP
jgi:hypothetical protein